MQRLAHGPGHFLGWPRWGLIDGCQHGRQRGGFIRGQRLKEDRAGGPLFLEDGHQGAGQPLELGVGGVGQDQFAPARVGNQCLVLLNLHQARTLGALEGVFQGLVLQAEQAAHGAGGQGPFRQGQQPHQGGRGGGQSLQSSQEDLPHEIVFGLQGRGLAGDEHPGAPLPGQRARLLGQFQEIPQQPRIAQALGDEVGTEGLRKIVPAEQILQHEAQIRILQPVHAHQGGRGLPLQLGDERLQSSSLGPGGQ